MSYGLLDVQRNLDQSGKAGLQHAAELENRRKQEWEQIKQQDKANRLSSVATGTAAGFAVGGPIGAAVGAGAGLLGYELF